MYVCVFTQPVHYEHNTTLGHSNIEHPSLSYYLPTEEGKMVGFVLFLKVLALCEMQPALSRIETIDRFTGY